MRPISRLNVSTIDIKKKIYIMLVEDNSLINIYKLLILKNPNADLFKPVFIPITSILVNDNITKIKEVDRLELVHVINSMMDTIITDIENNTAIKFLLEFETFNEFLLWLGSIHNGDSGISK